MPIVNLPQRPPTPPTLESKVQAKIYDKAYKHSLIDAKVEHFTALLTHIEGSTWVVDYYSQVLGGDEELSPFQPNQIPPYQQYSLIKNYELKMQGSLSTSDNEETTIMTVTGSATTYPFLKPNIGDAFIADIGDGFAGQFTVTNVTKKTIFKETCYEISFELSRYATESVVESIDKRVVKTGFFQRDYLTYGQNPVITSDAVEVRKSLETYEKELLTRWFYDFYSQEYGTALIPGQDNPSYDPFVVKAILTMYNVRDVAILAKLKLLNCDGLYELGTSTFWDALLNMDEDILYTCFKPCQLIPVSDFNRLPFLEGVRFSGVDYVMGAMDIRDCVDKDYRVPYLVSGIPLKPLNDWDVELASDIFNNVLGGLILPDDPPLPTDSVYISTEVAAIHPVTIDRVYVVSQEFYDKSINRSKLEVLINEYFTTGQVNTSVLIGFCQSAKTWGRLEKYYYTPILLAMLKVSQRLN